MTDRFEDNSHGLTSPGFSGFEIAPNDDADLRAVTRGLYVGTTGDLCCLLKDDATPVTFRNAVAGALYPIRIRRIYATGTTAGDLVGLE